MRGGVSTLRLSLLDSGFETLFTQVHGQDGKTYNRVRGRVVQ